MTTSTATNDAEKSINAVDRMRLLVEVGGFTEHPHDPEQSPEVGWDGAWFGPPVWRTAQDPLLPSGIERLLTVPAHVLRGADAP